MTHENALISSRTAFPRHVNTELSVHKLLIHGVSVFLLGRISYD